MFDWSNSGNLIRQALADLIQSSGGNQQVAKSEAAIEARFRREGELIVIETVQCSG